jgi:hypothetical protein
LECTVSADNAGSFQNELHVFWDDAGLRETVLTVHGTVGPPAKTN